MPSMHTPRQILTIVVLTAAVSGALTAATYTDTFTGSPSLPWNNQTGTWSVAGDRYTSSLISHGGHSLLPYAHKDFTVDVDVFGVSNGGVWLRAAPSSSLIGVQGVLLAMAGNELYWHVVPDGPGSPWGPSLGSSGPVFTPGDDIHVRIEVNGNDFAAFLNGVSTPVTTLSTAAFASGRAGLYGNSFQEFDNFVICDVPEPGSLTLLGAGLALLALRSRRK